ncbi:hypothetical protein Hanom_Chr05g00472891 [Helianthus anomalus]
MIIPTEVTMLNVHAAMSITAFLSALLDGVIFTILSYSRTEECLPLVNEK